MLQDIIKSKSSSSDRILVLTNQTWEDYEQLSKGNPKLHISYSSSNNEIKIVSPSQNHELIARIIGILINAYCRKDEIDYYALGSADIKKEFSTAKQPDASYCFKTKKDIPDLAIEVNFTSGSIEDLEKYKILGVQEVWMWQDNNITFYVLTDGEYQSKAYSKFLYNPDLQLGTALDSSFLNKYIIRGLSESARVIETDFFNAL